MTGGSSDEAHGRHHESRLARKFTGLYTGPYFDPKMPQNVSAQVGQDALITCAVNQIGRRTVKTHAIFKWSIILYKSHRDSDLDDTRSQNLIP